MIHTFEITRKINKKELDIVLNAFPDKKREFNEKLKESSESKGKMKIFKINKLEIKGGFKHGIKSFHITYCGYKGTYITFSVEPMIMLEGKRTVELFQPTTENVNKLKEAFRQKMIQLLNTLNKELINLEYWDYHRVDYSVNFKFDTCEDKELFFLLVRKTSKRIRSQEKRVKEIPLKYQSIAEGNKSHKKIVYDKYEQIDKEYKKIKVIEKNHLLAEAENIVRFEVQCYSRRIKTIKKNYNLSSNSILNYLSQNISERLLLKEYENFVGSEDFYSLLEVRKIFEEKIQNKEISSLMANKLILYLKLISKSKSYKNAEENFVSGMVLDGEEIKGTMNTLGSYNRKLKEMGINRATIPKDKKIHHFKNPVKGMITL